MIGSFTSGGVRIPATFHGTARLLEGTATPTPPRPARHDDLQSRFEADLEISFPLLVGVGYQPVDPSHPAYPLYLAASAEHERAPAAAPAKGIDPHSPNAVVMPFATTVIVTEAMALQHGLVAPGRAGSTNRAEGPVRTVRRKTTPPPWHGGVGTGAGRNTAPPPQNGDIGDALPSWSAARPGAAFVGAPFTASGPATQDDLPALAGVPPSSGTSNRVVDIVMASGASLPPAIRAVIRASGGGQAGPSSAASAVTTGPDVNHDVLALLRGMREADRSPQPTGSMQVAQAGESDAATLPHVSGRSAAALQEPASTISVPPASLTTSNSGLSFIKQEEEQPGVSNTLHHPSSTSGVTLGPGYDMKRKTADQIIADLVRIGVARNVAEKISGAVHLAPDKIDAFIKDNKSLINLTSDQQARLLALTIGSYEDKVRRDIKVPLEPYQFDALVSFLYNPGQGWPAVRDAINKGDFQDAALAMKKQVKSGGEVLRALVGRRRQEADLLLTGNYGTEE